MNKGGAGLFTIHYYLFIEPVNPWRYKYEHQ